MGQSRHIQRPPKTNFVRYAPNSDHSTAELVCRLSADFVAKVGDAKSAAIASMY
jgi:hypothetical protein